MLDQEKKQGFTLVEMMVVVGIFLVVTGVILINVPNFREKTSVDLVAQDIAVTIRSSQVFGVGTRALYGNPVAYGVSLSVLPDRKNGFVLFADINKDFVYNNSDSSVVCGQSPSIECQSDYSLNGFTISSINLYRAGEIIYPNEINISFERPKSNPRFCINEEEDCPDVTIEKAEIVVQSLKEQKRKVVVVYANGQIAVEDFVEDNQD